MIAMCVCLCVCTFAEHSCALARAIENTIPTTCAHVAFCANKAAGFKYCRRHSARARRHNDAPCSSRLSHISHRYIWHICDTYKYIYYICMYMYIYYLHLAPIYYNNCLLLVSAMLTRVRARRDPGTSIYTIYYIIYISYICWMLGVWSLGGSDHDSWNCARPARRTFARTYFSLYI